MPDETKNAELLGALDAGIAAADAMPVGADAAEVLTVAPVETPPVDKPPVEAEPVPVPVPADTPPADTPPVVEGETPPVNTPPATPEDAAAKAEADADAAAADEARKLGFKNEKGVQAYQAVHREARTAKAELATFRAQVEEELQPRAEAFTKFRDHMDSIGCKPEQFGLAVSMIDAMNSGEPKKLEAVAVELENQLAQVRGKLGLAPEAGKELFDAFPDLAEEVAAGDITARRANELARVRKLELAEQSHATAVREKAQETTAQTTVQEAAITEAVADLDALGAHLAKIDPHFPQKVNAALTAFQKVQADTPPHKWETTFRRIYDEQPNPAAPAKRAPVGTVPLRGTGAGAGAVAVASTPMDALNAGLEAAARGQTW